MLAYLSCGISVLSPSRLDVLSWLEGRSSGLARSFCGSIRGGGVAYTHIYIYIHTYARPRPPPPRIMHWWFKNVQSRNSRNTVKLQIFQNPGIISRPVQIPLNLGIFRALQCFARFRLRKTEKLKAIQKFGGDLPQPGHGY